MQRRSFLSSLVATAAGLLVPAHAIEPERVYSFMSRQLQRTAILRIYDGPQSLDMDGALGLENTVLSEMVLHFTRDKNGFQADGADQAADRTGVASFARLEDGAGRALMDMQVRSSQHITTGSSIRVSVRLPEALALAITVPVAGNRT